VSGSAYAEGLDVRTLPASLQSRMSELYMLRRHTGAQDKKHARKLSVVEQIEEAHTYH